MISRSLLALAVVCAAFTLRSAAAATPAEQANWTAIFVTDMHCGECAKKIARKLYAVPSVVEVRADVSKNLALVVPATTGNPSPKAMWEAVEAAGFKVVKMAGPGGEFTSKPAT